VHSPSQAATVQEEEVFAWTSGLLKLRSTHPALQTGIEQNLFADENVFVLFRSPDEAGCAPDHSPKATTDRLLIVVNKAARAKLWSCPWKKRRWPVVRSNQATAPATGIAPVVSGGKLHIEEPAQSMTVYDVH